MRVSFGEGYCDNCAIGRKGVREKASARRLAVAAAKTHQKRFTSDTREVGECEARRAWVASEAGPIGLKPQPLRALELMSRNAQF